MSSGHIREYSRSHEITPAGQLADALRNRGHDVMVAPFTVTEIGNPVWTSAHDHTVVGLAPLRGLGSAYMYGALAAINLFGSSYSTYLSSPDGGQTQRDLNTMSQNPKALVDPFFHYKRGWITARDRHVFPELVATVRHLAKTYDGPNKPIELSTGGLPTVFSHLDELTTKRASNG